MKMASFGSQTERRCKIATMLSPGKYHRHVPRQLKANLAYRRWILNRAARDIDVQTGLKEMCRRDILFFINTFGWQFNPVNSGHEVGPFICWEEFQDKAIREILDAVYDQHDALIEKSREMGASWLILFIMVWCARFFQRKSFLVMSRKEDLVDSESSDSLFWKVDFILRHLPEWLCPPDNIRRRSLLVGFKDTQSALHGEATTGKAGVGGRHTAIFLDEFSQVPEDREILHRTSDTARCRIFNGTHLGQDTAFYELSQRETIQKIVMHWTQHPEKKRGAYRMMEGKVQVIDKKFRFDPEYKFVMDGTPLGGPYPGIRSPYYDEQCRRKGSARAIAMDLDIDPRGSVSQYYDRALIGQLRAQYACLPFWEGDLIFDRETAKPQELRKTKGGLIKLWCHLDAHGRPPIADYAAGLDISTGEGATPSCLSIANRTTGEKLLQVVTSFMRPELFAAFSMALFRLFVDAEGNGPYVAWENVGPGIPFGKDLYERFGYRRVLWKRDETKAHDLDNLTPNTYGWFPSNPNIRLLHDAYQRALRERTFLNRSDEALAQCLEWKFDEKKQAPVFGRARRTGLEDISESQINHGDVVVADALCNKMCDSQVVRQQRKEESIPLLSLAWRKKLWEQKEREESA